MTKAHPPIDEWVWGTETILWGFDPSHQYTFKVLAPKKGRPGCLSLQYHSEKSESWFAYEGKAWALLVIDGKVCTRILEKGAVQNINVGTIHRLMGITGDCKILEPSTPDRHAANKADPKDIIRLHCVLGRPCEPARDEKEKQLVDLAIQITEEACQNIDRGELPKEYNLDLIIGRSGFLSV